MQFLLQNKYFYGPEHLRPDDARDPLHIYRADIENRRSRLFPDRKRVPGRKAKYIFVIAMLLNFYALERNVFNRKTAVIRDQIQRQMQRRISPFFTGFQDINFVILKHRYELIIADTLKLIGGRKLMGELEFFKQRTIWHYHMDNRRFHFIKGGFGRNFREPPSNHVSNAFFENGYETQNI